MNVRAITTYSESPTTPQQDEPQFKTTTVFKESPSISTFITALSDAVSSAVSQLLPSRSQHLAVS